MNDLKDDDYIADEDNFHDCTVDVYTDGACFSNGGNGARAGIGVFWAPDHPMNISERLEGRQTNNRAEIKAATRALEQAYEAEVSELVLHTDSQFLINGATKWIEMWKRNGWKLQDGTEVINRADFEALDRAQSKVNVQYEFVPGHSGNPGNEAAHKLANRGARLPR